MRPKVQDYKVGPIKMLKDVTGVLQEDLDCLSMLPKIIYHIVSGYS